jgi:hypothetical protein
MPTKLFPESGFELVCSNRLFASAHDENKGVAAKAAAVFNRSLLFIGLGFLDYLVIREKINPGIVDIPGFMRISEISF